MMYVVFISENGNIYVREQGKKEYVFNEGKVKISSNKFPLYVESSKGVKFLVTTPYFSDYFQKSFKRKAQIIHEKDIGYIMRRFYMGKDAKVLEAGSGSGHATIFLSFIFKKVVSLEKRKDFYSIVKKNLENFNITNVELYNCDLLEFESNDLFDLVLLDFKNAYEISYVQKAKEFLKPGGFLVLYLPVIEQVIKARENLKALNFVGLELREIILREWQILPLRPIFRMLGHTAFILSARRF